MKLNRILAGAFALLLTAGVAVQSNATTLTNSEREITVTVDPTKTEISATDLPAAVKKAVTSGDYAQYKVQKAFKVTTADGNETYEIHFTNDQQQEGVVTFDKMGKEV